VRGTTQARSRREFVSRTLEATVASAVGIAMFVKPMEAQWSECDFDSCHDWSSCEETEWGCGEDGECADHPCAPWDFSCETANQCWTTSYGLTCCDCVCECGSAQVFCICTSGGS
jgi:hypothetical protein